jgi:hypothetical protein
MRIFHGRIITFVCCKNTDLHPTKKMFFKAKLMRTYNNKIQLIAKLKKVAKFEFYLEKIPNVIWWCQTLNPIVNGDDISVSTNSPKIKYFHLASIYGNGKQWKKNLVKWNRKLGDGQDRNFHIENNKSVNVRFEITF